MKFVVFFALLLFVMKTSGQSQEQKSFTAEDYIKEVCSPLETEQQSSCFNEIQKLIEAVKNDISLEGGRNYNVRSICSVFAPEQQDTCINRVQIFIDALSQNPEQETHTEDYIRQVCQAYFDTHTQRVPCFNKTKELIGVVKSYTPEKEFNIESYLQEICSPLETEQQTSCFNDIQILIKAIKSHLFEEESEAQPHTQDIICPALEALEKRFFCLYKVQYIRACVRQFPDECLIVRPIEPCNQQYPLPETFLQNPLLEALLSEMKEFCSSTLVKEEQMTCLLARVRIDQQIHCAH